MTAWPANGSTDWNTAMADFITQGHATDGTHKKSEMLTDMGWDPTALGGDASDINIEWEFPNGLQVKVGKITRTGDNTQVTYTTLATPLTAFTNFGIQVIVCSGTNANVTKAPTAHSMGKTGFKIHQEDSNDTTLRFIAVGR